jgi:excisionase family DNA binding protein
VAGRPDDILTAGEAARLCALSRSTLRRMVAAGRIAAWRTPGQHLRVSRQDCLDYLRSVGAAELAGRVAGPRAPVSSSGPLPADGQAAEPPARQGGAGGRPPADARV